MSDKRGVVVGRSRACDIILTNDTVSRQHVRIYRDDDKVLIEDLDSKNGTVILGKESGQLKPHTPSLLDPRDEVIIAGSWLDIAQLAFFGFGEFWTSKEENVSVVTIQ